MQLHYWALAALVGVVVAVAASCVAVASCVAAVAAGMPFGFASSVVAPVVKIGSVYQKVVVGQTFVVYLGETSVAASFVADSAAASFAADSAAASFVADSAAASFALAC